jgi:peptidoglycan-associated lipoprotein
MNHFARLFVAGLALAAIAVACGPKYPNCDKDEQCKDHNQYCVDKVCRDCATSDHCKAKGPCAFCGPQYTCEKPAGGPGDCCSSDLDCKQGKCWKMPGSDRGTCAQCAGDTDCGPNMKCIQGGCVPNAECDDAHPCPSPKVCQNGSCITPSCSLDPIYFDFDEFAIRADARSTLNNDNDCIKKKGQAIVVQGNCDERGSDEYNLALGQRRADAAKKFLLNLGVGKGQLSTTSFGEEKPVCSDHSEDCWSKNRRDDFQWK